MKEQDVIKNVLEVLKKDHQDISPELIHGIELILTSEEATADLFVLFATIFGCCTQLSMEMAAMIVQVRSTLSSKQKHAIAFHGDSSFRHGVNDVQNHS